MLVLKHNGDIVGYAREGARTTLPNGDVISPAQAGWTDGTYALEPHVEPAPLTPTEAERRASWRPTAKLSKARFLIAAREVGLITRAEAKAAARGTWPASFNDALVAMSARSIDPDDAEIFLAGAAEFYRNDPIIGAIKAAKNLQDEQIDAIFGWL